MKNDLRKHRIVLDACVEIAAIHEKGFLSTHVVDYLRSRKFPMGAWEVRMVLAHLTSAGSIFANEDIGGWHLNPPEIELRKAG